MPHLVSDLSNIGNVYADGAYTYKNCFDAIVAIGAKPVISIRTGTSLAKNPTPELVERNRIVKEMWAAGGRAGWKKTSDYHRRSLAETHMFRNKQILRDKLSSIK